jgi:tricorn protease
LTGPLVFAQETRLLRSPSINHDKISFVYAGDIWVAGKDGSNVQRITAFDESNPHQMLPASMTEIWMYM